MKGKRFIIVLVIMVMLFAVNSSVFAGNNPPTSTTTLPYYTSKTRIYSYTYTARKFKPYSTGYIYFCFYGQCQSTSPATTIVFNLYRDESSGGVSVSQKSYSGSYFPHTPQYSISGLDTSKYYYGKVTKNNTSEYMDFKIGYGRNIAEASNFTFN